MLLLLDSLLQEKMRIGGQQLLKILCMVFLGTLLFSRARRLRLRLSLLPTEPRVQRRGKVKIANVIAKSSEQFKGIFQDEEEEEKEGEEEEEEEEEEITRSLIQKEHVAIIV